MQQLSFHRVGAGAAMLGAALGIVFNLLHPRNSEAFESAETELQMIADSGIWRLDHLMLLLSVAIGFVGFIAIAISMANTPGEVWARVAIVFGAAGAGLALVLLALDGFSIKDLADRWAGGDDAILPAATAMVETNLALLAATFIVFFGLTPLLFGEALLTSAIYSKTLAYLEMLAGGGGLLTGLLLATETGMGFAGTILLPLSALVHTIVLFVLGWRLWQKSAVGVSAAAPVTTAT